MNSDLAKAVTRLRKAESDLEASDSQALNVVRLVPEPASPSALPQLVDRFGNALNSNKPIDALPPSPLLDSSGNHLKSHPSIAASPPPAPTWRISVTIKEVQIDPDKFLQTGINMDKLLNTLVIGDLHGNSDLLLSQLEFFVAQLASGRLDPSRSRLLQIGDLINKGPDSAGVVEIFRLIEMSTQGMAVDIPAWLEKKGFDRILSGLKNVELVMLRGNHEEFDHYGMHLIATDDIPKYALFVSEMMGKGLPDTVRSYLIRHPEAFENSTDRDWLRDALKNPPVKGSDGQWRLKSSGVTNPSSIEERQALDFYQKFQFIWLNALQKTGDLSLFEKLRPLLIDGNTMFVHGGPPKTLAGYESAMAHAVTGSAMSTELMSQAMWTRSPTDPKGLESVANMAFEFAKTGSELSFPVNSVVGHTMVGAVYGKRRFSLPDGSQGSVEMLAGDYGFPLGGLLGILILPNGEAVGVLALRGRLGIETETLHLESFSKPGLREFPNRFPNP